MKSIIHKVRIKWPVGLPCTHKKYNTPDYALRYRLYLSFSFTISYYIILYRRLSPRTQSGSKLDSLLALSSPRLQIDYKQHPSTPHIFCRASACLLRPFSFRFVSIFFFHLLCGLYLLSRRVLVSVCLDERMSPRTSACVQRWTCIVGFGPGFPSGAAHVTSI